MATAAPAATAIPFTPSATSAAVEIALIKQRQRDRVASLPKSEVQEYQESKQTCIPPSRSPLHSHDHATSRIVRTHVPPSGPATHSFTLPSLMHSPTSLISLVSLASLA